MSAMSKMGPLSKVLEMVPGMSQMKLPKDAIQGQEKNIKKWRFAMNSMTKEELEDPEVLSSTRIDRISKGSGISASDIRALIKQYRQSKKLVKMLKGKGQKGMEKMMKGMQGKMQGM